ncbi:MAG: tRNA-intron lyase [Candidatus Micrarchaeaceae archaeon]
MLKIEVSNRTFRVTDDSTKSALQSGFYGILENGAIKLDLEEALYLIDSRNAECSSIRGNLDFISIASKYWRSKKFLARYFAYKDWRDRGLIARRAPIGASAPVENPVKKYPVQAIALPSVRISATFFKSDLIAVVREKEAGKLLYERYWIGQYGSYKAADRGQLSKLDVYETMYLIDKGILFLDNISRTELVSLAEKRHSNFSSMYEVYADWRDKGYVIKTGFKFGTNFRVYFPGARPGIEGNANRSHSKHVIHVFPRNSRMLISEWARAIRVAHSVRKTFLLAMPGSPKKSRTKTDFVLYHRHGGMADDPAKQPPHFAMLALGEEEYLGGNDLASAIEEAAKKKLELLLAIVDRETAVTYYTVRRILLPKSRHEYYEIDWLQP